jgi:CRP-like cAMP-binding protein
MITVNELKMLDHPVCESCIFKHQGCSNTCQSREANVRLVCENETLFYEGDTAKGFYTINAGVIKISKYLADGRRFIIGFFYPGDIVGLTTGNHYTYTAEAVTDAGVSRISSKKLKQLIHENHEIANRVVDELGKKFDNLHEHMMLLARKTPREKIATFLLKQAAGMKTLDKRMVELQMSRSEIADHLGLTIETVCRVLTKMKSDHAINVDQVKTIHFLNFDYLCTLADGNDNLKLAA